MRLNTEEAAHSSLPAARWSYSLSGSIHSHAYSCPATVKDAAQSPALCQSRVRVKPAFALTLSWTMAREAENPVSIKTWGIDMQIRGYGSRRLNNGILPSFIVLFKGALRTCSSFAAPPVVAASEWCYQATHRGLLVRKSNKVSL